MAVGAFDAEARWALDGATSMTAWLRQQGMSTRAAGSLARTGRRMHQLPVTAAAWLDGSCRPVRCRPW